MAKTPGRPRHMVVSSSKILQASQQTSFGASTSRPIGRSGQLYDTQLVPEINNDDDDDDDECCVFS